MIRDLRFALRALARDRRFVVVVVLTLAIGIAVNTTVFTLLNAIALRPLPAPDAGRVVRIYPVDAHGQRQNLFSFPDYVDYAATSRTLAAIAAYIPVEISLGAADPARTGGAGEGLAYVVSSSYFEILGMQPVAGRPFLREEDSGSGPRVAIINERLWQRRFNRDHRAIGASIELNGHAFTIVGVAPARFIGSEPLVPDVWIPLAAHHLVRPESDVRSRDTTSLLLVARLRSGATRSSAAAELSTIARRLAHAYPADRRPAAVDVVRGSYFNLEARVWPVIAIVMAIAGVVLVIACANVANLTLARAASRQRELAIRLAIGATRARLVRLLVAETLIVGAAGAAAGLLASLWTLRWLYPFGVSIVPFPAAAVLLDLDPDVRVFAYTFALATIAGLAIGLAPALQLSLRSISPSLQDDGGVAGTSLTPSRVRHALAVLQVAACVVLLAAAGLLTRAAVRARTLDLGFDAHQVVMSASQARRHGYPQPRAAAFNAAIEARATRIPGLQASAFTSHVPLTGGLRITSIDPGDGNRVAAPLRVVTSPYFDVLRIPIVAGRTFSAEDGRGDASVAILSEALARRFWPDADPIGRSIRTTFHAAPATIVGIVRDTSGSTLWQGKEMAIYYPVQPSTDPRDLRFIARFAGDVNAAAAALRSAARQLEPALVFEAAPLSDAVRLWMLPARAAAAGAGVLALIALALASVGLYSVLAYDVVQRTREIGIRMALGADSAQVLRLVIGDGTRLIVTGIAAGLGAALLGTRALRALLLDVSAHDPLTFAIVSASLLGVGLGACYLPARRAARIQPLIALRKF